MTATVHDVMTATVVAVTRQADFKQIVSTLRRYRVSACPVIDEAGRVIGMVSEADLLFKETDPELPTGQIRLRWRLAEESKATAITAAELMTSPPVTIGPRASVIEAARLMQRSGVKRLPVVGADGQLLGIVSRVDVLAVYERPDTDILAEVLGLISGPFGLDPEALKVTVSAGVVTLAGLVASPELSLDLLARIRQVEGVVAVRNRLAAAAGSDWSPVG